MTASTAVRPVGVGELQRAWRAVRAGQFVRDRPAPRVDSLGPSDASRAWCPEERVVPVVGALPQAGATTLALALATAAAPARVVECSTMLASGLAAAAIAELGTSDSGWLLGRRDNVRLVRSGPDDRPCGVAHPLPDAAAPGTSLSVLDVGSAQAATGWVAATLALASRVVVLSAATVPGLRRLEAALAVVGPDRAVAATRGSDPRRWPRELRAALGPAARHLQREGRWVTVPHDRHLAVRGLDSLPLPPTLLAAARDLLRRVDAAHDSRGTR